MPARPTRSGSRDPRAALLPTGTARIALQRCAHVPSDTSLRSNPRGPSSDPRRTSCWPSQYPANPRAKRGRESSSVSAFVPWRTRARAASCANTATGPAYGGSSKTYLTLIAQGGELPGLTGRLPTSSAALVAAGLNYVARGGTAVTVEAVSLRLATLSLSRRARGGRVTRHICIFLGLAVTLFCLGAFVALARAYFRSIRPGSLHCGDYYGDTRQYISFSTGAPEVESYDYTSGGVSYEWYLDEVEWWENGEWHSRIWDGSHWLPVWGTGTGGKRNSSARGLTTTPGASRLVGRTNSRAKEAPITSSVNGCMAKKAAVVFGACGHERAPGPPRWMVVPSPLQPTLGFVGF
jgi:hypothetical protein